MTLIINRSWSFYGAFDHLWSWPFVKQFRLSWFSCERTEASSWPSRPPFLWLYFDLEVAHWMQCCTRKKNQRTLRTWHTNHTMTDLTWHGLKHGLKWSILIDKLIVSDCNGSHMEPWSRGCIAYNTWVWSQGQAEQAAESPSFDAGATALDKIWHTAAAHVETSQRQRRNDAADWFLQGNDLIYMIVIDCSWLSWLRCSNHSQYLRKWPFGSTA